MLEDVNDEIPLFTEREQETVLEGEPIGTKVTQVNAIDKDGTFPNNQVSVLFRKDCVWWRQNDRENTGNRTQIFSLTSERIGPVNVKWMASYCRNRNVDVLQQ